MAELSLNVEHPLQVLRLFLSVVTRTEEEEIQRIFA